MGLGSSVLSKDVSLPGNAMSGVHSYQYDLSDRLVSWSDPLSVVSGYSWDGRGNRLSAGLDTYTYDARNRITSGPDGTYTYTARGTLSQVDDGVQANVYGFDSLGRLSQFDDGVSTVTYTYDGLGRVATRNATPFVYSGFSLDPVSDGTFTYGRSPAGRLISQTDGVTSLLAGLDRHGDLSFLYTAAGVVSDTAVFDPFGDPAAQTGLTDPTLGFQADFTDPVSGQVWLGARWYDGGWAAFLSRDTVFGELRSPVSLNRFTYANNNPLSYWDPDGRKGLRIDGVLHVGGDAGGFRKRFGSVFQVNTSPQTAESVTVKASYAEKLQTTQAVPVRKQIPVDGGFVDAPGDWGSMTKPQQMVYLSRVVPEATTQNGLVAFGLDAWRGFANAVNCGAGIGPVYDGDRYAASCATGKIAVTAEIAIVTTAGAAAVLAPLKFATFTAVALSGSIGVGTSSAATQQLYTGEINIEQVIQDVAITIVTAGLVVGGSRAVGAARNFFRPVTTIGDRLAPYQATTAPPRPATTATNAADDFASYGGEFLDDAIRSPVVRPDLGNLSAKIQRQMAERGWAPNLIDDAVLNGRSSQL